MMKQFRGPRLHYKFIIIAGFFIFIQPVGSFAGDVRGSVSLHFGFGDGVIYFDDYDRRYYGHHYYRPRPRHRYYYRHRPKPHGYRYYGYRDHGHGHFRDRYRWRPHRFRHYDRPRYRGHQRHHGYGRPYSRRDRGGHRRW
jgi:hypothetical protein